MENFQPQLFPLGQKTWAAGTNLEWLLTGLPPTQGSVLPHCLGFVIELDLDPTYTTAPTVIGHNKALNSISIYDGKREWLPTNPDLNMLRAFEQLERGKIANPEAILGNGSTNNRFIRRFFTFNNQNLIGQPSDGLMPCAYLMQAGKVSMKCSPLTDISADCTAATGTVNLYAVLVPLFDKLIFAPYYPRRYEGLVSGQIFPQKALYGTIFLTNDVDYGAIAAGDFGNIQITLKEIDLVAVAAEALTAGFNADFRLGQIDAIMGEPRDATYDVNGRQTNLTTPTALAAQTANLQIVAWIPPDTRQSKLRYYAPQQLKLEYSGANTASYWGYGRYEPIPEASRMQMVNTALLNASRGGAIEQGLRMYSGKTTYDGPYRDFMPYEVKLKSLPWS